MSARAGVAGATGVAGVPAGAASGVAGASRASAGAAGAAGASFGVIGTAERSWLDEEAAVAAAAPETKPATPRADPVAPEPEAVRVAVSLWSVPREQQLAEAQRLARAGAQIWHWDRSDGSMARAGGFTAAEARGIAEATGCRSEAHLMLRDPAAELAEWLTFCERVVVHTEATSCLDAVAVIQAAGRQAAVAISPGLPLPAHSSARSVLIMSVTPGEGGSAFLPETVERVAEAAARFEVGVDGGVDADRAASCIHAGARWIVSGTAVLRAADPAAWLREVSRS